MSNEQIEKPQKRGCRRYFRFGCITLLILAVPFYWFCLHTTPLKISKETTYITEPLTPDGKHVDYYKALKQRMNSPEMKTDNNGYRLVVQQFGFQEKDIPLGALYEELGLKYDAAQVPPHKVISPFQFLTQFRAANKDNKSAEQYSAFIEEHGYWTEKDIPQLADWEKNNNAGCDVLVQALNKPVFCIPNRGVNIFLPGIQHLREFSRCLHGRALLRIGDGNIDGAIDDIIAVHKLARFTGQQGTLMTGLLGLAIEGTAQSIGINANPDKPATKEQLLRLLKERNALPPMFTYKEILETERLFCMMNIQRMFSGKGANDLAGRSIAWSLRNTMDENIVMRQFTDFWNTMVQAKQDEVIVKHLREHQYDTFLPSNLFVRQRSQAMSNVLIALLTPALGSARESFNRLECQNNLLRIGTVLLLYEKEHGTLPDETTMLATGLIPFPKCPSDTGGYYEIVTDKNAKELLVEKYNGEKTPHKEQYNVFLRSGAEKKRHRRRKKMNDTIFEVDDIAGTEQVGRFLAEHLPDGSVVALVGTLGAGKTRLVQAAAEALGVERGTVSSPTFVLLHEYTDGVKPVYHFDAYRLTSETQFRQLGPDDYFEGGGLTFIEWADKFPAVLPKEYWEIRIDILENTKRRFTVSHGSVVSNIKTE
ncbi:MAG: tRNA (adenosine(37)-N6)-threonylcarbamoyltransferase complex ATPase subunit type 1 TsaE [Planctomycetaceae bacterium]|jgi:tRNA threonylcarbamoyladenosine biosynthesis protein TsaE|nr:tRNA (adenosine(37)-N6)-threonylcarbamoyltransferase complex ATPase subunit type 1 TsaE [Planctomycetaceae bacterium]